MLNKFDLIFGPVFELFILKGTKIKFERNRISGILDMYAIFIFLNCYMQNSEN